MRLFLNETPKGKARPRFNSHTGRAYSQQKDYEDVLKLMVKSQMSEKGICALSKQPLYASLTNYIPMPQSWSQRKKNAFLGRPAICKPDVDNCVKLYCDVMNRIAYEDDAHISQLWCEKLYWDSPGVEINLTPIGGDMIQEHAKTVKGEISMADLEYMIKKAHRIGLSGRSLTRVFSQEDGEGKHIYFECECIKEKAFDNKGIC